MVLANEQDHEHDQRNREKSAEGFGQAGQRSAPTGFNRMHEGRKKHPALGHGRHEQKADQVGLPGLSRVLTAGLEDEGDCANGDQAAENDHQRGCFFWFRHSLFSSSARGHIKGPDVSPSLGKKCFQFAGLFRAASRQNPILIG